MKINGFIIYSPIYCRNSAGVYALYKLASDLKKRGYIALTTIWYSNNVMLPVLDVPIIPNIVAKLLVDSYGFVVIYPEVISGNPLHAKHVVRWVMNTPGLLGGEKTFDDNEIVISYNEHFDKDIKNKISGHLSLPTLDLDLFYFDKDLKKTDITVYTGKHEFKPGYVDRYDNLVTRTSPSHEKVAEILRKTKTLYTFDNTTAVINEALLCGCNVVLIPDGTKTKEDFKQNEVGDVGIQWFDDFKEDMFSAEQISNSAHSYVDRLYDKYEEQTDRLIQLLDRRS